MIIKNLLLCALIVVTFLVPAAAREGPKSKDFVDVQMECNTMVGAFEIDAIAAREVLPAQYQLDLQPSGNALVYLQASNCDGTGNGEYLGAFDLADAWLAIQGPFNVTPVPGADLTIPLNVYVLKAQTPSKWVKRHCAAIHFPKELIRYLDVGGPIVPGREGFVEEITGREYSWSELIPCMDPATDPPYGQCWMSALHPDITVGFAISPYKLGINLLGFVDRSPGNGAKKDMQCLMTVKGQGIVQLHLDDPKSNLAKLGLIEDGQYGYFYDSTANCHLVMSEN